MPHKFCSWLTDDDPTPAPPCNVGKTAFILVTDSPGVTAFWVPTSVADAVVAAKRSAAQIASWMKAWSVTHPVCVTGEQPTLVGYDRVTFHDLRAASQTA